MNDGPFIVQKYIALPGDRVCWVAIHPETGIQCAGRDTEREARDDCAGLNAAYEIGREHQRLIEQDARDLPRREHDTGDLYKEQP